MHKEHKITFVMLWHISERGGGAEVQANYLAQELAERGYNVSYICQTTKANKVNTTSIVNGVNVLWLKPANKFVWLNCKVPLLRKLLADYAATGRPPAYLPQPASEPKS